MDLIFEILFCLTYVGLELQPAEYRVPVALLTKLLRPVSRP